MALAPDERKLARLAPQSLAELAYRSLRESIVTHRFAAGERLVETRLAEELGTSRAPVREALRRLAEEHLVVERPRQGTFVREFTAEDFVDIYNLRMAIETAAIRLVTRRGEGLEPLEAILEDMGDAAGRERPDEVAELEFRLHETLCEMSGNAYLSVVFRSLAAQIRVALALDDAQYADLHDIVAEHVPLLEAIRSGDERRAAVVLQQHVLATVGPVLARLGGSPDDLLPADSPAP
jgi:DNA-binding GntR family transcriptional regulator